MFSLKTIQNFLNGLFHQPDNQSVQVRQEMLIRKQSFRLSYNKWFLQKRKSEILKNLYTSFTLSKMGISGEIPMHYFQDSMRHFLLIHYIETLEKDELCFLQDYFKDAFIKSNYCVHLSERKIFERTGYIEKSERHILKPKYNLFQIISGFERAFSILVINIQYINERPLYLEIIAERGPEQKFTTQQEADHLAELLFY